MTTGSVLTVVVVVVVRQRRRQEVYPKLVDFLYGLLRKHKIRHGAYLTVAALLRRQVVCKQIRQSCNVPGNKVTQERNLRWRSSSCAWGWRRARSK